MITFASQPSSPTPAGAPAPDVQALRTKYNITPAVQAPVAPPVNIGGAPSAAAPKTPSFLSKVGSALTSNEQALGSTVGQNIAVNNGAADQVNENAQKDTAMQLKVERQIHIDKLDGKDTSHLQSVLDQAKRNSASASTVADIAPSVNKTNSQVAGELGGVALDLATAGTLSNEAKGLKAVSEATKIATGAEDVEKSATVGSRLKDAGVTYLKSTGKYGSIGYGYDVANNFQEGKTGEEALKPGAGTAVGVVLPGLGLAKNVVGAVTKDTAPRLINSLVKPLLKDFSYGKNPGRAVSEEGITANSLDEFSAKIGARREEVGSTIGQITKNLEDTHQGKAVVNLESSLSPIDEAIKKAERAPNANASLIQRLHGVKEDLMGILSNKQKEVEATRIGAVEKQITSTTKEIPTTPTKLLPVGESTPITKVPINGSPAEVIGVNPGETQFAGATDLRKGVPQQVTTVSESLEPKYQGATDLRYREPNNSLSRVVLTSAAKMKTEIGDMTKWTGNHSDDAAINAALKSVYGKIKDSINTKAAELDPVIGRQLKKMNEKYADLTSAEIATKYRDKIEQRQDTLSLKSHIGAATGIVSAIVTGGGSIPVILAGLGGAVLDKALGSTAVKTRVAAWLAKESPSVIEKFYAEHPKVAGAIHDAFEGDVAKSMKQKIADTPNKQGGFLGVGAQKELGSMQDITKNLDSQDMKYMQDFIDSVNTGSPTKEVAQNASRVAEAMNLNETTASNKVLAKKFAEILDAKKKDPTRAVPIKVEDTSRILDEINSSGGDWDKAIEAGDLPLKSIYADKVGGAFTQNAAEHVVSDLKGKMNLIKKGLGDGFDPNLDNPTRANLLEQARKYLKQ